jgi:hypothetical protein
MTQENASTRHDDGERCPVCGRGTLVDISFDLGGDKPGRQSASSREVKVYSCGHEVPGPSLDLRERGGADLDVERRTTDETVPPVE